MTRFLVIRLSSIGDIVHALPAVSALGESFPQAEIAWVVEPRYAGLLRGNPFVHEVLEVDTLAWRQRLASARTWAEMKKALGKLRHRCWDVAIDFQGLVKTGLIAGLSGAPRRIGLGRPWLKERAAAVFYTEAVAAKGRRHVVEEGLALVEQAGAKPVARERWQFPLPSDPAESESIEARLRAVGAEEFIIINPGGGWMAKRWPPAHYRELIRRLDAEAVGTILLTGSRSDEGVIREILEGVASPRAVYFPSNLTEFIALARRARLLVGGDSGPLHLAAAVGTPLVAIYGPTSPARNGPFSPADLVVSTGQPINHTRRARNPAFLEGVSVEAVHAAVRRRLEVARG